MIPPMLVPGSDVAGEDRSLEAACPLIDASSLGTALHGFAKDFDIFSVRKK